MLKTIGRHARWAGLAVVATLVVAACGGSTSTNSGTQSFKGTKKFGYSASLSGGAALYGHAASQALQLGAEDLNAKGGVNGYKIETDIQDDGTTVDKAVANAKQMMLQDNVVAMTAPVTSAQCQAVLPLSKQNKIPMFAASCNSYQLTTESDLIDPYFVGVPPNTYMEGVAAGKLAAATGAKKIFVVSPNYIFGKSETNAFVATLKRTAPSAQIVNDQSTWYVPFPTNPRWDATINAIQAAKPDLVYSNIFAGDEINFITQALAVDPQFFTKYPMTTLVSVDELNALGAKYPDGMHAYMRAPFFALEPNNPKLTDFITRYRARFNNEYPSDWALMAYDGMMMWAQAANAAKSFDGDKVMKQIVGKSFDSLRGYKITIRAGDQQANVGETTGITTSSNGKYPFPILKDQVNLKGDDIIMPVAWPDGFHPGR